MVTGQLRRRTTEAEKELLRAQIFFLLLTSDARRNVANCPRSCSCRRKSVPVCPRQCSGASRPNNAFAQSCPIPPRQLRSGGSGCFAIS
jgi:hypothetical protein